MNGFLLFVGEEWVFLISVAGFIFTLLGLILTVVSLKEHKRTKIVVITLLSIITLVCAISAISYIVLKNTDTPSTSDTANEEQPSDSESSDDYSTDENSSNSDSTAPTMLKLYAEPSTETAKWGYVDGDGNIVIPYIYDWADDFINGYAAVSLNYRWGFIDMSGNEMIAFDYNEAWSFIDGLAPVFNGDKWGFIDETGNVKIPFKYAKISRTYINGKQVYIDENDNVIDYENEPSSTSSSSSSSTVPVRDFIQSYVSATETAQS